LTVGELNVVIFYSLQVKSVVLQGVIDVCIFTVGWLQKPC